MALQAQAQAAQAAAPLATGVALESLKFRYTIAGANPPWKPLRAFDDRWVANPREALIVRLSVDLQTRFGRGFGWANLFQTHFTLLIVAGHSAGRNFAVSASPRTASMAPRSQMLITALEECRHRWESVAAASWSVFPVCPGVQT
jgi:hypothetical protein